MVKNFVSFLISFFSFFFRVSQKDQHSIFTTEIVFFFAVFFPSSFLLR